MLQWSYIDSLLAVRMILETLGTLKLETQLELHSNSSFNDINTMF